MRVAVTGASGLIGTALVAHLRGRGDDVLRMVRGTPRAPDEVRWDPTTGYVDLTALEGVDGVVHLAGAGVGDRLWTKRYRAVIRDSRVAGTRTIATAVARLERRPAALVSGSAIGYYGDTGDTAVDETASAGRGFLADVCVAWEAAADPAREAGIRVAHPRTGVVVPPRAGAVDWRRPGLSVGLLWPIVSIGLGGRIGSGRQWWSFISLRDEVRALAHLLEHLDGPVNLTAPNPARNAEVVEAMGRLLHRPTVLPVPAAPLRLALGEFADQVLGSTRVLPSELMASGFSFLDPTIDAAVAAALAEG